MIRTYIIPCDLPVNTADALNLESGRIYTKVMITHYRIYRRHNYWLSQSTAEKLNDYHTKDDIPLLHAHSKDAAQQSFYKACKTAKANSHIGAKYPKRRKKFRTTIWKNTAIYRKGNVLFLSNAKGQDKIEIIIPESLQSVLMFREVRLVFNKQSHKYEWHLVVENGKQPKEAKGTNVVSVDLGEIHPAVIGDEKEATIISCRERRHEQQGYNKRMATLRAVLSRKKRGSLRYKRLIRTISKLKAKHKQVIRDMEHKISRAIVDVAVEREANIIVLGDVRDIANGVDLGKQTNQRITNWDHGKIRSYVEYKAEGEGIAIPKPISEAYSSQTCPNPGCNHRHKPRGRNFKCPVCGFQSHRDVVGQVNILSKYKYGQVGKIPVPPIIKHRIPYNLRAMRRCRDTGLLHNADADVARKQLREAAGL